MNLLNGDRKGRRRAKKAKTKPGKKCYRQSCKKTSRQRSRFKKAGGWTPKK